MSCTWNRHSCNSYWGKLSYRKILIRLLQKTLSQISRELWLSIRFSGLTKVPIFHQTWSWLALFTANHKHCKLLSLKVTQSYSSGCKMLLKVTRQLSIFLWVRCAPGLNGVLMPFTRDLRSWMSKLFGAWEKLSSSQKTQEMISGFQTGHHKSKFLLIQQLKPVSIMLASVLWTNLLAVEFLSFVSLILVIKDQTQI